MALPISACDDAVDRQKQTGGSVEELSHCKVQPASCGARDHARTALALKAIRRDGFFYGLPCRGPPKTSLRAWATVPLTNVDFEREVWRSDHLGIDDASLELLRIEFYRYHAFC